MIYDREMWYDCKKRLVSTRVQITLMGATTCHCMAPNKEQMISHIKAIKGPDLKGIFVINFQINKHFEQRLL